MARLIFAKDLVRRLVEHSRATPGQQKNFDGPIKNPSLFLVKDEGAYLMSAGEPGLLIGAGPSHVVAYAKGYDPTVADRGEVWDRCSADLGGDDFSETLPCSFFDKALADDRDTITVNVTGNRISISALLPKPDADERAARMAVTLADLFRRADGARVLVGKKRGDRKVKIWTVRDDSNAAILARFDRPVILTGLPLAEAAAAAIARLDN